MNDLFEPMNSSIIKVIGVGGGGSNAVGYMYNQGIVGVDFAVCNTDKQALEASPVNNRVQLGIASTEGLGAGSIPEVGRQSCIESIDDIREFLQNDTKMLFITAGMGGGTGTGAAPIIAKAAKELDILTVAIVTMPFKFEGTRRSAQAIEGLEELKKNVDSLLVISNERLKSMYTDLSMKAAFAKADDILTTAAKGIAEIITVPGYINVDFRDVNTVMKCSGVALMGYAEAEGEDRALTAVKSAIASPLLEDNDIRGAQHILLNISSGSKEITMGEISDITEYISEEAGYGTDLIWGNCEDDSLGDKLSVTIIATGFDKKPDCQPEKVVVSIDDEPASAGNEVFDLQEIADSPNAKVIEFDDLEPRVRSANTESINTIRREEPLPPEGRIIRRVVRRVRADGKPLSKPLDSPRDIAELEDVPAYKRKNITLSDSKEIKDTTQSKLSINLDAEGPIVQRNNSFFHNNVD
jgi:cell division protein FtsZ